MKHLSLSLNPCHGSKGPRPKLRDKGEGTPFLPSLTGLSWFESGNERGTLVPAYLGKQAEHTRQLEDRDPSSAGFLVNLIRHYRMVFRNNSLKNKKSCSKGLARDSAVFTLE